jgi:hypothetical protein
MDAMPVNLTDVPAREIPDHVDFATGHPLAC